MKRFGFVVLVSLFVLNGVFALPTKYFSFVDENASSEVVGVREINKSEISDRTYYRFEYSDTKLKTITFNDAFNYSDHKDPVYGSYRIEFEWPDASTLLRKFYAFDGHLAPNSEGVCVEKLVFNQAGVLTESYEYDADMNLINNSHGVAKYAFEYFPKENQRASIRFDVTGKQITDLDKAFRKVFTYGKNRISNKVRSYDAEGQLVDSGDGITVYNYVYDDFDQIQSVNFAVLDEKGNEVPVVNKDGIARYDYIYDKYGYILKASSFALSGKPKADNEGAAVRTYAYDVSGYLVEKSTFGIDGLPCEVDGVHKYVYQLDSNKRAIKENRLTRRGDGAQGIASVIQTFDDSMNLLSQAYFDNDGDPFEATDRDQQIQYAKVVLHYDNGQLSSTEYFDKNGTQVFAHPTSRQ